MKNRMLPGVRERVRSQAVFLEKVISTLTRHFRALPKAHNFVSLIARHLGRFIPTIFHGKSSDLALNTVVLKASRQPLLEKTILFESFHGEGALCNPEAIFRYMISSSRHEDYNFIWSLKNDDAGRYFRSEFEGNSRVKIVETNSPEYFEVLHRAEFLVNNSTFPPRFIKREGQTYLNTWHGTPLKKMLYDTPAGPYSASNTFKNMLAADFLLSQNSHMSKVMYRQAFGLENLYPGTIIEDGYPRTDLQFLDQQGRAEVDGLLAKHGIDTVGKRIILYAPTWRGDDLNNPEDDVDRLVAEVTHLNAQLADLNISVLLRVHQFLYPRVTSRKELAGFVIPNEVPANQCLGIAAHLITDFSSIFFDYLSLDRPIHFYAPDQQRYETERGLYFEPKDLPGSFSDSLESLIAEIRSANLQPAKPESKISASAYTPFDDGRVTSRIVSYVFDNQEIPQSSIATVRSGKSNLLIFPGGFLPNGITTSALNFLSQIDYDKFRVIVLLKRDASTEFVKQVDPRAQIYFEPGGIVRTRSEVNKYARYSALGGNTGTSLRHEVRDTFKRESKRLFSDLQFDAILDFDGYSGHWAQVLGATAAPVHAVWQHNDLWADSHRLVNGRYPHKKNLEMVFNNYDLYDHLVSVSDALSKINREKLSQFASSDKFTFVENFLDEQRILRLARGQSLELKSHMELPHFAGDLVRDVAALRSCYSPNQIQEEFKRQKLRERYFSPETIDFVFVGRVSPEKGLELLIEAFSIVAKENQQARLIIVGDGPSLPELKELSNEYRLHKRVVFTGHQSNGLTLVDMADCFVMSSKHEGQPMVLLEAQVLGKPIVSSRFPAIEGALRNGNGLVTERDPLSLAKGMITFLNGDVQHHGFSVEEYNQRVHGQLLSVLSPVVR